MPLVPDFQRSLSAEHIELRRELDRREVWLAELEGDLSIRALGTRRWLRLEVPVETLRRHEERFGDDPAIWLLAAIMADVNEAVEIPRRSLRLWDRFSLFQHIAAPRIGCGKDGKAVAYWVNAAREALPKLRRYWLNHLLATALMERCPAWVVQPPYTLRQSMEMGAQVERVAH